VGEEEITENYCDLRNTLYSAEILSAARDFLGDHISVTFRSYHRKTVKTSVSLP
jgi:hypothetical protein